MDNPVFSRARRALRELIIPDEPLGVRVCEAVKYLQPILENPNEYQGREEIIQMINDASDENATPKERAESVADAIEIIFSV